jgi:hypothetical protein
MKSLIIGAVMILIGRWLYRRGVEYDRRHGHKRK